MKSCNDGQVARAIFESIIIMSVLFPRLLLVPCLLAPEGMPLSVDEQDRVAENV